MTTILYIFLVIFSDRVNMIFDGKGKKAASILSATLHKHITLYRNMCGYMIYLDI